MTVISTLSFDQVEIMENIMTLHCPNVFELDPTYSKGVFFINADAFHNLNINSTFSQKRKTRKRLPLKNCLYGIAKFLRLCSTLLS